MAFALLAAARGQRRVAVGGRTTETDGRRTDMYPRQPRIRGPGRQSCDSCRGPYRKPQKKERADMYVGCDADVQERRVCRRHCSAIRRVPGQTLRSISFPALPPPPGGRGAHGSIGRASEHPTAGARGGRHQGVVGGAGRRRLLRAIGRPTSYRTRMAILGRWRR